MRTITNGELVVLLAGDDTRRRRNEVVGLVRAIVAEQIEEMDADEVADDDTIEMAAVFVGIESAVSLLDSLEDLAAAARSATQVTR